MKKKENSSFSKVKDIKKILVIVPHEDDEINVAGGILANHSGGNAKVKVVYTTNGDCFEAASVRQKEATESLKVLGVDKENIIFLGYSDQMDMRSEVWRDRKGRTETQGTMQFPDYRYFREGYHGRLSLESMARDIQEIISDFLPDEIYCVDFDSHSDHRVASLAFEVAMGEILKREMKYSPKVYKGFAYPTAFKGVPDLGKDGNSTKFVREEYASYEMQNPYYKWEQRVRFPVADNVRNRVLKKNILYKALAKHKSQLIIWQSYGIINEDQIFWQRRTDNLLRQATIEVSSGERAYLNDFILFDITNIMEGNSEYPRFDKRVWIPNAEDAEKCISVDFRQHVDVKTLVFYLGCNTDAQIKKIKVSMDNGYAQAFEFDAERMQRVDVGLQKSIQKMRIEILEVTGENAGFSEIEVLGEDKAEIQFIKLMENEEFCYTAKTLEGKTVYIYDGYSSKKCTLSKDFKVKRIRYENRDGWFIEWPDNPKVYDFVECKKEKHWQTFVIKVYNIITLGMTYCWYRVLRKMRNIVKLS